MNTQKIVFEQDNKQVIQQGNHFFTRVTENGESFESGDFNTLERAKASLGILPTITENNKLLAEFLGLTLEQEQERIFIQGLGTKLIEETFNTDWNWLMEVVEKIESLGYRTLTENECFMITKSKLSSFDIRSKDDYSTIFSDNYEINHYGSGKTDNTYNACVEFVKWYNKNK